MILGVIGKKVNVVLQRPRIFFLLKFLLKIFDIQGNKVMIKLGPFKRFGMKTIGRYNLYFKLHLFQ